MLMFKGMALEDINQMSSSARGIHFKKRVRGLVVLDPSCRDWSSTAGLTSYSRVRAIVEGVFMVRISNLLVKNFNTIFSAKKSTNLFISI